MQELESGERRGERETYERRKKGNGKLGVQGA